MTVSYFWHQIMWASVESLVSSLRIKRWEGTDHLYWRESGRSTSERKGTRGNLHWWRALLPSISAIPPRGKTLWYCLQTQFNFELLQIWISFFSWNRIFQKLFCWFFSSLFIWICYATRKKKKKHRLPCWTFQWSGNAWFPIALVLKSCKTHCSRVFRLVFFTQDQKHDILA